MASICDAALHFCAVRLTRLDALGNPVAGPNNSLVSDNPIDLTITPAIETGDDKVLKGGCGCVMATSKDPDLLKRFDLELTMGRVEPALEELLTGATAILAAGAPIGVWFPNQVGCDKSPPPLVCIEGWQDLWEDDHQAASPYPYIHWVFTASRWQRAPETLGADFTQPKFSGATRGNKQWGTGIYGDQPEAAGVNGGWFYSATRPTAACGYKSQSLT